ncbi:hypothetical protein P168DRAFT_314731 [Aspergillus campestris IBT 28561]|uniref:GPI anchored protein n=1 Tax=Aspergillus campestris (strain IBT 28561) TaxID=1392248 RepID=A0A2I1DFM3_ASPC2|nr:uncharacterized protein P168DRAFT_314731 [Aspergillus campestris IBT 28561]PKY08668.1 hypothetical protein P168DRAFT_314731 [Aspergillus campestris IBT 28561]
MRTQQLLALSGLMLMSNVVAGAELERDDVPSRCWHVCGPVVAIARTCDNVHHDNDRAEMDCICDWNKTNKLVPICEACIAQYRSDRKNRDTNRKDRDDDDDDWDTDDEYDNDHDDKDPHDNDAYDIVTSCNLKTTTYNSAAATKAADSASSSGTAADTMATPTGSAADSTGDTASAQKARTTENAAPGTVAPKAAGAAAVAGLGFLAYL